MKMITSPITPADWVPTTTRHPSFEPTRFTLADLLCNPALEGYHYILLRQLGPRKRTGILGEVQTNTHYPCLSRERVFKKQQLKFLCAALLMPIKWVSTSRSRSRLHIVRTTDDIDWSYLGPATIQFIGTDAVCRSVIIPFPPHITTAIPVLIDTQSNQTMSWLQVRPKQNLSNWGKFELGIGIRIVSIKLPTDAFKFQGVFLAPLHNTNVEILRAPQPWFSDFQCHHSAAIPTASPHHRPWLLPLSVGHRGGTTWALLVCFRPSTIRPIGFLFGPFRSIPVCRRRRGECTWWLRRRWRFFWGWEPFCWMICNALGRLEKWRGRVTIW